MFKKLNNGIDLIGSLVGNIYFFIDCTPIKNIESVKHGYK